jgi:IS5 family transposase
LNIGFNRHARSFTATKVRYSNEARPKIEIRFVIGLLLLNGMPDEVVCQRWVYDSYFQRFIGLEFFQHAVPARAFSLQPMARR